VIAPSSVLRARTDVRYRVVDRRAILIRQSDAEVVVLNEVGARVLDLLQAGTPVREVLDAIATEFEVSRADLDRDVLAFLRELVETGILEEVGT
jgi:hypothetical protein